MIDNIPQIVDVLQLIDLLRFLVSRSRSWVRGVITRGKCKC